MKRKFNNFIERGIQYEKVKNEKIEMKRRQKEKDIIKGISFKPQRISRNIEFTGNHMSFIEREKVFLIERDKKIKHKKNTILYKEEQMKNKKLNQRRRSADIEIKCDEITKEEIEEIIEKHPNVWYKRIALDRKFRG